jgi:hypothetical protein
MATWGTGNQIGFLSYANSYTTGTAKFDVSEMIHRITPEDTPFYNMIGDGQARGSLHQWLVEELTGRALNAVQEGAPWTGTGTGESISPPISQARSSNLVQTLRKSVGVSRLNQRYDQYGVDDLFGRNMMLRMREWKLDCEHALIRGSQVSGISGTAQQMAGFYWLVSAASGNVNHSGTSFTEARFNTGLQNLWAVGGNPGDVLCGANGKRRISSFTARTSTAFNVYTTPAESKKVINTISVYESDFGTVQVHLCRDVRDTTTDGQSDVLIVTRSFFKKAWVDKPFAFKIPPTADGTFGMILGDLTLESGATDASSKISNTSFLI